MTNTETQREPNPYNARKPWHDEVEDKHVDNAYTMYMPPKRKAPEPVKAAPTAEPVVEETDSEGNYVKRYFDLKRHHDKTVPTLRSEVDKLNKLIEELKAGNNSQPTTLTQEVKPAEQAQPTEAKPIETPKEEPVVDEKELRAKKAEAKLAIFEAHPDFNQIVNDAKFHEWAERQTEEVQASIYDNPFDANRAIEALDLYKKFLKESQKPKQDSVIQPGADAAVSPRAADVNSTQRERTWTKEDIKNMSVSDWEKYREEILRSLQMKGR